MATPSFTEARRFQQSVNEVLIRLGRLVVDEPGDLLRCGGQADEVKVEPSDQGDFLRIGTGLQPRRLQPGEDKAIDVVGRPGCIRHFGDGRCPQWLISPVLPAGLDIDGIRFGNHVRCAPGIDRTVSNPFFEISNHRRRQHPLGRHLEVIMLQSGNQQTFFQVARHDRVSRFAALANSLACVEQQSTLHLFTACRVTLVTVLHQNRPDFLLKKSQALRSRLGRINASPSNQKAEAGKCCGIMAERLSHDCPHPIIRTHSYNSSYRRNKGTSP